VGLTSNVSGDSDLLHPGQSPSPVLVADSIVGRHSDDVRSGRAKASDGTGAGTGLADVHTLCLEHHSHFVWVRVVDSVVEILATSIRLGSSPPDAD
jgi:hypothetical protein